MSGPNSGSDGHRGQGFQQRQSRLRKRSECREKDILPYADRFERTHRLSELSSLPEDASGLALAGRLILRRRFGKLTFAHIQDWDTSFQIALERDKVKCGHYEGNEAYTVFNKLVDIGDFLGVEGNLMRTKKGELTLSVNRFSLLSKALRPLPEKFHGLQDPELCSRQRHLDLTMNHATRERFKLRREVINALRDGLNLAGFTEVETPIMVPTPSGALATPFETYHQALDMTAYLRIAPETYLKRLLVGGFDRVYEFARSFRNEGMDPLHLQEFTLLEYYCAYWNYRDNMDFTEKLIPEVVERATGSTRVEFQGQNVDFTPPWPRVKFSGLLREHAGVAPEDFPTAESLREEIKGRDLQVEGLETMGRGSLLDQLYKKCCRDKLVQPVFVTEHPIDLSPLARSSEENPALTERFQMVAGGWELVNAYSELVDPVEQRVRFEEQAKLRSEGDTEAMVPEEDYLSAMEYGMPPASGWGLGLERFLCLLTDRENLRDVVFFPLMRPQSEERNGGD